MNISNSLQATAPVNIITEVSKEANQYCQRFRKAASVYDTPVLVIINYL